jgi:hypothetical protein
MKTSTVLNPWASWLAVLAGLGSFVAPTITQAQYSLAGSSFTSVVSPSTGGNYSLGSTVGTTGGGMTASGGSFSVTSSPWSVTVVETPGAPKLTIAAVNGAVRISWPSPSTDWILQQNTNSVRSVYWSNVTATVQDDGTTKTVIVSPPTGNRFYRLLKP